MHVRCNKMCDIIFSWTVQRGKLDDSSYGNTGSATIQEDYCCCCLHGLNAFEGPSLMQRNPNTLSCPNCLSPIQTRRQYITNRSTHVAALLLLTLCLCFLPYHLHCSKSVRHYCPVCNTYIGYSR